MRDEPMKIEANDPVHDIALKKAFHYIYNNNQAFYEDLMRFKYKAIIYCMSDDVYSVRLLTNGRDYEVYVMVNRELKREEPKEKFNSIW